MKSINKITAIFAIGMALLSPTTLLAQDHFQVRLQSALSAAWNKMSADVPGVGVAVSTPNRGMIYAAVGIGNVNTNSTIDPATTRFKVASLSKNFTATLIMRLQEAGYLNIDDRLATHLSIPNLPNGSTITIRQLLNHSAGVYDHFNVSAFWTAATNTGKVWTDNEILQYSINAGSSFTPGSSYGYSNTGYFILGKLAETKLGIPIDSAIKKWVFEPLGLKNTFLDVTSTPTNRIPNLAENNRAYEVHQTAVKTAGSVVATPEDVAKYMRAIFGTYFLTNSSVTAMRTPSLRNTAYGLGTRIMSTNGISYWGHTGTLSGYKSLAYYIPSMGVSVAIHANGYTSDANWNGLLDDVFNTIAAEYTGYCSSNACTATPSPANLIRVVNNNGSYTFNWQRATETTCVGYRLYYTERDDLTGWKLAANESVLNSTNITTYTFNNQQQFQQPPTGTAQYFRIVTVGNNGVESAPSDVYSASSNTTGTKTLIVDGLDAGAEGSSYTNLHHSFATNYYKGLRDAGRNLQIHTAANEAITNGLVNLNDYGAVVWFMGDESTTSETFSWAEQQKIQAYLQQGGKLIVSGSEIGWDLDANGSSADRAFYNNYLKADYVDDGAANYTPATGVTGTAFAGATYNLGINYPENYPDNITPFGGASTLVNYAVAGKKAVVGYIGNFGTATTPGGIVNAAFAVETASMAQSNDFLLRSLNYLGIAGSPTAIADAATVVSGSSVDVNVLANDQNGGTAFNTATLNVVSNPANGAASVINGLIRYTPNAGFVGADSLQYTVQNNNGVTTNAAKVLITVSALPTTPVCTPALANVIVDAGSEGYSASAGWVVSTSSPTWQGTNYFHDNNEAKGTKWVSYSPAITGVYDVFVWYVAGTNRATNVLYRITHDGGVTDRIINQQTNGSTWVNLGRYTFNGNTANKVQLRNDGSNNFVIADAVRFTYAGCPGGCIVPLTTEKIVDDAAATTSGTWVTGANAGFYGTGYKHDNNELKGTKSATFTANLEEAGAYELFTRHVAGTNRATNVPVDVYTTSGIQTVSVNQQLNNAVWVSLGTFNFDKGTEAKTVVRTTGTNGVVIADAFRWVYKGCVTAAPSIRRETNVVTENAAVKVQLYPNPTNANAYLAFTVAKGGQANWQVLNSVGQPMLKQSVQLVAGTNQITIPAGNFKPGWYIVQVVTADGQRITQRLVKQ